MKCGLIGVNLSYSFSQELHGKIAGYEYFLQELSPEEVEPFLQKGDFDGLNVTIPYKQAVLPYLDGVSERAERIGAVNTVVRRDGRLWGDNTDYWGMQALLAQLSVSVRGKKVLILGTGGTSRTAKAVLEDLGAETILKVSRTGREGALTYARAAEQGDVDLVINTTPVGTAVQDADGGRAEMRPVSLTHFPCLQGAADVIYNPLRTDLLLQARRLGVPAAGGLYMLVAQAVYAAALFRNVAVDAEVVGRVYRDFLREKENIVLVGMPGCGKSTAGRILARRLGRQFVDTDAVLEEQLGCTPGTYIRSQGEGAFRQAEEVAVARVSRMHNCVIATGGGTVLSGNNVRNLQHNGRLYFLDRSLEKLPVTDDRPLSAGRQQLTELYHRRRPYYLQGADVVVPADGSVEQTVMSVLGER